LPKGIREGPSGARNKATLTAQALLDGHGVPSDQAAKKTDHAKAKNADVFRGEEEGLNKQDEEKRLKDEVTRLAKSAEDLGTVR